MTVRTHEQYIESLRKQKPKIYMAGEEVSSVADHHAFKVGIEDAAVTYKIAHDPEYRELSTLTSPLINEDISLWTHIPQNAQEIISKVRLMKAVGEYLSHCCYRCITTDGLSAAWALSYEIDQKYHTDYHQRVIEIVKEAQRNDWIIAALAQDAKGDRSLSPGQQSDPDMFLHVVERRNDGIVVRGAKTNGTASAYTNMLMVSPSVVPNESEKDYAVGFFTPVDTEGITFLCREPHTPMVPKDIDNPYSSKHGGHVESMVVFDNVFIPWERVYLCGEYDLVPTYRSVFFASHVMHKCMCRWSGIDIAIGAAALVADYNGLLGMQNIQEELAEMMVNAEIVHSCALASALEGRKHESGVFVPNIRSGASGKLYAARSLGKERYIMQDTAGGLVATMASEEDYKHPTTRKFFEKYYKRRQGVPTEHVMRAFKLVEDLTASDFAGWYHGMCITGGGPPRAQKFAVLANYELENSKKKAARAAGIIK